MIGYLEKYRIFATTEWRYSLYITITNHKTMSAFYFKQEMPDLNNKGKQQCYYRLRIIHNLSTDELMESMVEENIGIDKGQIVQVITAMTSKMARLMADGYSITLDNLGTFHATIGVREGFEQDTIDGKDKKRNARSLEFNGVSFRPHKSIIREMNYHGDLIPLGCQSRLCKSPLTKEQRILKAVDYLSDPVHPVMRILDYARMTGLSRTVAANELRVYRESEGAKITTFGLGTNIVYIKKVEK